jgi:hypothetical protein
LDWPIAREAALNNPKRHFWSLTAIIEPLRHCERSAAIKGGCA